ncbi:unnamed protein product [Cyprideis torosa]|uniref:Uncharacterized protein n=1 Tax=Cyprideis torosa TaxID=163714 RepID=A0A7R8VZS3_9CRUS|nr:unnamed protein product [Cyprideis torosa]CAG0878949.1 unnamed protein product [Cyprideis torosa]
MDLSIKSSPSSPKPSSSSAPDDPPSTPTPTASSSSAFRPVQVKAPSQTPPRDSPSSSHVATASSSSNETPAEAPKMAPRIRNSPEIRPRQANRILLDIPCKVCSDYSSGKHYGIYACDGCAGFFKRTIRHKRKYPCKGGLGDCVIDKTHRNQCRACRLDQCLRVGMNRDAVQHERGPRNSTIRKQMELMLRDRQSPSQRTPSASGSPQHMAPSSPPSSIGESIPSPPLVKPEFIPSPNVNLVPIPRPPAFLGFMPPVAASPPGFAMGLPGFRPFSATLQPDAICEHAARLLFMGIKWAKGLDTFTSLEMKDQITLLQGTWKEILLLNAAQFLLPCDMRNLYFLLGMRGMSDLTQETVSELQSLSETVDQLRAMGVDYTEYACFRAIVLFRADSDGLIEASSVQDMADQSLVTLSKYCQSMYPNRPSRFGRILLSLPTLREVRSSTIEKLFFRNTIGHMSLDKLIVDMYKNPDF